MPGTNAAAEGDGSDGAAANKAARACPGPVSSRAALQRRSAPPEQQSGGDACGDTEDQSGRLLLYQSNYALRPNGMSNGGPVGLCRGDEPARAAVLSENCAQTAEYTTNAAVYAAIADRSSSRLAPIGRVARHSAQTDKLDTLHESKRGRVRWEAQGAAGAAASDERPFLLPRPTPAQSSASPSKGRRL